jgi:hypothetical protein
MTGIFGLETTRKSRLCLFLSGMLKAAEGQVRLAQVQRPSDDGRGKAMGIWLWLGRPLETLGM